MMGRPTDVEKATLQVPSGGPLSYCRLCFSTRPCKKIEMYKETVYWIEYIQRTVGIQMSPEEDAPFAICLGCKMTLESVDQFRVTCRLHDNALRQFREQNLVGNTEGGESTSSTVREQLPVVSDASADDSKDAANPPIGDNMCAACNMKLPSTREYRQHMKQFHRKSGGIIPCPLCPSRFRKSELFQRHIIKHSNRPKTIADWIVQSKLKTCRICRTSFQTCKELGKHEEEQHGFTYKCRLCFLRFDTEQEKNSHKIMHLAGMGNGRKRRFKCKICPRMFPNRHCLNIHVKKHEKCYMCWTCKTKLTDLETYLEHQTTVHKREWSPNQCSECGVTFVSRGDFLNHMNLKHAIYAPLDLADDEFSESEGELEAEQPGQSKLPEPETVSISSDDFPTYLEDNDMGDDDPESTRKELAITNVLEEELMLHETPHNSGFDLYGTAFQPQISVSLVEELSD